MDLYLDEKGPSVKIQLLIIFKDHHVVAYSGTTATGHDRWLLSNVLWMKFYNVHGKYKAELSKYFQMNRCCLNLEMLCATSALGI